MRAIAIAFAALWMCVDCGRASAAGIMAKCRPLAEPIHLAAEENGVPYLLMVSLAFAESSCNTNATHARTKASGVFQVLATGAGIGYSTEDLKDAWLNARIAGEFLSRWRNRCGSWRGAVAIFNGSGKCSSRTRFSAKVIREWQKMEKESERVS
jgi:hypothetical protein